MRRIRGESGVVVGTWARARSGCWSASLAWPKVGEGLRRGAGSRGRVSRCGRKWGKGLFRYFCALPLVVSRGDDRNSRKSRASVQDPAEELRQRAGSRGRVAPTCRNPRKGHCCSAEIRRTAAGCATKLAEQLPSAPKCAEELRRMCLNARRGFVAWLSAATAPRRWNPPKVGEGPVPLLLRSSASCFSGK